MRIYAKFEDVGSETFIPVVISIEPFYNNCYYLDLEKGKTYYSAIQGDGGEWKMYNGSEYLGEFLYNPKTGDYINSSVENYYERGAYVRLEDGRKILRDKNSETYNGYESNWCQYQDYKEGKPVGEPYWKNFEL